MRYLTARKRAEGKGASGTGTEHHWYMQVSAVGLAFLIPTFLYIVGNAIGGTHEEVLATFSRPFPALLTGMTLFVGMMHFNKGAHMMIEDYARGSMRKALIMLVVGITYGTIATGLYALAKIAL